MHPYLQSHFSCVRLFTTPWTIACQAPLSMGFSRQEYWSGLSCPSPGHLPDPGIAPTSLSFQCCQVSLSLFFFFFFDGFALVFVTVSYKKKKERRINSDREEQWS